jgi:hypothetical protein
MSKDDATLDGAIDKHVEDLSDRLDSILGSERIPRRAKRAKAEAAMQAVDDLVEAVEEEIKESDSR